MIWVLVGWLAAQAEPAVVSGVRVVSDKVVDVSSFEAWKNGAIRDGMSDEQKVLAAWETVVRFRHHDAGPHEHLGLGSHTLTGDAFKLFNVYGYCNGTAAQAAFLQLVRQLGYEARAFTANRWDVPEVKYGEAWHYLDPALIAYFRKPDGQIASVEELVADVKAWHEKNPGILRDDAKIRAFQKTPGWKQGPPLLVNCPTYDAQGNFSLNFFGWFTAMIVFDGTNKTPFPYEQTASQGYRANLQLRKGERLTRNWSHKGLHANADEGVKVEALNATPGKGAFYYTPAWGDLAPGRVGNGTLEYAPPLDDLRSFLGAENVAWKAGALQPKDPAKPATLVLRMPSAYVYLTGELALEGDVDVHFSDTHGRAWTPLGTSKKIDLTPHVLRRYDYRLKLDVRRLSALKITHDIQHSQRALPALEVGENAIDVRIGPPEGTITIEGAGPKAAGKQATCEALGAVFNGLNEERRVEGGFWMPKGPSADVTLPVETPGDLKRLRFGCAYKAGSKNEGWELQVSFDEGKTFKTVERAVGPAKPGHAWVAFSDVPPGTRKCLVRYAAFSRGDCLLWRFRIDADYAEPHGGAAPVKITYRWDEDGRPKEDVRTTAAGYTLRCAKKPLMKSIVLERAD
jgi:hypothetical protein